MHTVHAGYTIVAKIKKDSIEKTRLLLTELNKSSEINSKISFDKSPSTHFVTGAILPEQQYNQERLPATLIIATSFSGPSKKHLDELISIGATGLCELFANCENFPQEANSSSKVLKRFIKKHRHWDAYYTSMQYSTKSDIIREDKLRTLIGEYIDSNPDIKQLPPKAVRTKIQEFVQQKLDFKWATNPSKKTFLDFIIPNWSLFLVGLMILFLLTSPIAWYMFGNLIFKISTGLLILAIVFMIIILFSIRVYEKKERQEDVASRPADEKIKSILSDQSNRVVNTLTVSGGLKKGFFRPLFFKIALKAVISARAHLSLPTVYTCRWMSVDQGKRLVFLSNFINTSESYVRDFIDNKGSAKKINLLFGQGAKYPITKWIIGQGALDNPDALLYGVMANHHPTEFWYCPYQHLSLENIKTNKQIYNGLYANFSTEDQINDWLNLL